MRTDGNKQQTTTNSEQTTSTRGEAADDPRGGATAADNDRPGCRITKPQRELQLNPAIKRQLEIR